jgi:hypothetical protein
MTFTYMRETLGSDSLSLSVIRDTPQPTHVIATPARVPMPESPNLSRPQGESGGPIAFCVQVSGPDPQHPLWFNIQANSNQDAAVLAQHYGYVPVQIISGPSPHAPWLKPGQTPVTVAHAQPAIAPAPVVIHQHITNTATAGSTAKTDSGGSCAAGCLLFIIAAIIFVIFSAGCAVGMT